MIVIVTGSDSYAGTRLAKRITELREEHGQNLDVYLLDRPGAEARAREADRRAAGRSAVIMYSGPRASALNRWLMRDVSRTADAECGQVLCLVAGKSKRAVNMAGRCVLAGILVEVVS